MDIIDVVFDFDFGPCQAGP